jgi:hypothetical protein
MTSGPRSAIRSQWRRKESFTRKVDAGRLATMVGHDLQSGSYPAREAGRIPVGEWADARPPVPDRLDEIADRLDRTECGPRTILMWARHR